MPTVPELALKEVLHRRQRIISRHVFGNEPVVKYVHSQLVIVQQLQQRIDNRVFEANEQPLVIVGIHRAVGSARGWRQVLRGTMSLVAQRGRREWWQIG